jgi:hypothetical protein
MNANTDPDVNAPDPTPEPDPAPEVPPEPEQRSRPAHFATFVPDVKAVDVTTRSVTHLITNDSWDRAGDTIDEDGWEFDDYKRNPVVMADHRYSIFSVIGVNTAIDKGKGGVYATTRFDDQGLGAEAFRLHTAGLVRAWSVGFNSRKGHSINDGAKAKCPTCVKRRKAELARIGGEGEDFVYIRGWHFLEQALLEYSLVAVPCNQDIVSNAIREGLVAKAHAGLFFEVPTHDAPAPAPTADEPIASPGSTARVRRAPMRDIRSAVMDLTSTVRSTGRYDQLAEAVRNAQRIKR